MPSPSSLTRRIVATIALLACFGVTADSPAAAAVTPQGVGSAARDDGRVDVVERTGGGTVRLRTLQGATWSPWTNLDGFTQHDPEVASWGNDRVDVFAVGWDGALWHRAQVGTTWTAWQSLGGYATSSPAAVYSASNRLDVLVRGTDGALWGRGFNGTAWSGWYGLGGYTIGAPTVASWAPNRFDVFAAGGDRQLWHRPFSGAWGNWSALGGALTAAPGATSWGNGRLDVVGRGGDGAVWWLSWLGTRWSAWSSLGGATMGAPDLASRTSGTLDLVTRGANGSLYTRAFNGAWAPWAAVPNVHQGLEVDDARIPAPVQGFNVFRIFPAQASPRYLDGVGAFRVNCSLSHMNYDDPIVFPGQPDATHLHAFFGNTAVNAMSNSQSILNTGNSTCTGGTANRSAYWAPAMVDTSTGAPVQPWGENGLQVYYKSGYRGVASSTVRNFPAGLRMIAGDSRRTTPFQGAVIDSPVNYHCINGLVGTAIQLAMPNCPAGHQLAMAVRFPQCWDGVNLDSPNHQSHMAYGTWGPVSGQNGAGCPASHPVPLPEITMNMRYVVPPGGMAAWRLSSDTYSGPAGYSGHADWWNGWHAPTFQRMLSNCYPTGLDCQMNLLGDGWALN